MRTWTKPKALRRGDLVAVVAPSGAVDPLLVERGAKELRSLGFRVTVPEDLTARHRFAAGSPERRLRELEKAMASEDVRGVFCARGGAGAASIMEALGGRVGWEPKVFVGYSDLTFLHLLLQQQGLVTFYGPMVARELASRTYDRASFLTALTGEGELFTAGEDDLVPLREGSAEGRLLGGCLSILASSAGTPWRLASPGEKTILFLEDQDEPPYRIDRMLRQLRASGAFEGVAGFVFGDMKGCAAPMSADFTLEDVLLDALSDTGVPIALGLSSGHAAGASVTLPLGVQASLTCGATAGFSILEAAVL